MKKNLIAVAVAAAFITPAVSMAEVTVYGIAQVEVTSVTHEQEVLSPTKDDPATTTVNEGKGFNKRVDGLNMADNAMGRIGIKATEDLGDGYTGLAKFEFKTDTADGNAGSAISENKVGDANGDNDTKDSYGATGVVPRETMVGLKAGWGQVELGRLKSPYKYAGGVAYDPFVATALEARGFGGMSKPKPIEDAKGNWAGAADFGHSGFLSKTVAYRNKFGPVNVDFVYGPSVNDGFMSLSAMFKQGGIEAFVAMLDTGDRLGSGAGGKLQAGDTTYSATKLGGKYSMGAHAIKFQYEMTEFSEKSGPNKNNSPTFMFLGYEGKFGPNVFVVQYGTTDADGATGSKMDKNGDNISGTSGTSLDETYLAAGVIHKFSKTTKIFAGFRDHQTDVNKGSQVISIGLNKKF